MNIKLKIYLLYCMRMKYKKIYLKIRFKEQKDIKNVKYECKQRGIMF